MFTYPIMSQGGLELNEQSWYVYTPGGAGLHYGTFNTSTGYTNIASASVSPNVYSVGVSGPYILASHSSGAYSLFVYNGTSTLALVNGNFVGPGAHSGITDEIIGDTKNPGFFFLSNTYGYGDTNGGIGYVKVNGTNTLDEVSGFAGNVASSAYKLRYAGSNPAKIATRQDLVIGSAGVSTANDPQVVVLSGNGDSGITNHYQLNTSFVPGIYSNETMHDALSGRLIIRHDFSERDVLTYVYDHSVPTLRSGAYLAANAYWDSIIGFGIWNGKLLASTTASPAGGIDVGTINADGTVTVDTTFVTGGATPNALDICPYTGIVQCAVAGNNTVGKIDLDFNYTFLQAIGAGTDSNFYPYRRTNWLASPLEVL